jgi:hypothetical protein
LGLKNFPQREFYYILLYYIHFSNFVIWVSYVSGSNIDGVDHFIAFLATLQGKNLDLEHLRLALQVALLISPIFLLQEAQIHLSRFYVQRYKLALVCIFFPFSVLGLFIIFVKYSKALGNAHPPVIRQIELVIWRELLRIARGITTVQEAGSIIVQAINEIGDVDEAIRHWFIVGKLIVNACLHLVFN